MEKGVDSKVSGNLEELEQRQGQLSSLVELYRDLRRIQSGVECRIISTKLSLGEGSSVPDRLRNGEPLLAFEDFSPDWDDVRRVFEKIALWAARDSEDSSGESKNLRNIARNRPLLKKAARAWYQGHSLTPIARAKSIDLELLNSVLGAALKPFMCAYSRLLLPEVDQELWRRGYCPICGGNPDFAFLDKEYGARWLLCSRCDTEWLFHRLQCPFCGNQNQDTLAYLTDDEEIYRLYVCEQCKQYLKAIDLRQAKEEIKIPLERLFTLDIDMQARELGYGGNKPDTKDSTTNGEWRLV